MIQRADFVSVIPAPPTAVGDARNAGSHDVSPQYAMSTLAAIDVAMITRRKNVGPNISENLDGRRSRSRHTCGSSTLRRMMNAATAGSAPMRKSTRHPKRSMTTDEIAAANSAPIAHADCMNPIAFPRCCAGHVSATSTDPHDHSPAMANPTSNRHMKSCHGACEVASPAVASE